MKIKFFVSFFILSLISLNANDIHVKLLEPLLGIKYRVDGTTNAEERYTLFENEDKIYKKAGLNCSGFVLTASKQLLGKTITIKEAKKDINKNSDENSSMGKDWDFGRDLIQNIASNYNSNYLSLGEINPNSTTSDGIKSHDVKAWNYIFQHIKKENIYLAVFSKPTTLKGYKILYYHVGIIIKDNNKNIWLYHATQNDGVHKVWLDYDRAMTYFNKEFAKNSKYNKKVLILELEL